MDDLARALGEEGTAVLVAPPGTGKTTGVPPLLAEQPWADGRIMVVVPRRMAARAAAARMAATHGEEVGGRFGYSVRHDRRVGPRTRVEVVTTGLALRRIQADPSLDGVSAVLLDEFHERSVEVDLLLALLADSRTSLREDLRLVVMSATIDPEPVAALLGGPGGRPAPVVGVEARLHPIRTMHRPGSAHARLSDKVAEVVAEALGSTTGDILVFLPGRGEIRETRRRLGDRVAAAVEVVELHGSLPPGRTDELLTPRSGGGRRVILSTAVAETSVTVPGVRTVIDPGRRRTQEVDRRSGLPALVTRAVSTAGADQRRGRAGREAPGLCYRMWSPTEDELRRPADPPEITVADLSPLLLQCLAWGASSPEELRWLDTPPADALDRARFLLDDLGALDARSRLTALGRRIANFGFHPRLGAIAAAATDPHGPGPGLAADVIAVLDAAGTGTSEVAEGVRSLRSGTAEPPLRRAHRQWRRRLGSGVDSPPSNDLERDVSRLLLAGYADRLGRRRPGRPGIYHLRHGGEVETARGASDLGEWEWVLAVDLDARTGSGRPGVLHLGAGVAAADVERLVEREEANGHLTETRTVEWDPADGTVATTSVRRLGAVEVSTSRSREAQRDELVDALEAVVSARGPSVFANWDETAGLRARIAFLAATGMARGRPDAGTWPDLSEDALSAATGDWVPTLVASSTGKGTLRPTGEQLRTALAASLDWNDRKVLDAEAPTHWTPPSGSPITLRYGAVDGDPTSVLLAARLQRLIGVAEHPVIGRRRMPLTVELQSPAGRPVQRTQDLPGFWHGSYAAVRGEMRGRYPKHEWPERPWERLEGGS